MGAAREKDQADFDLERFVDMFDTAMMSDDPRVVETLRKLMMIVALTRPESGDHRQDRQHGPLRRMFEDMHHINRRMHDMEDAFRNMQQEQRIRERSWKDVYRAEDYDKYTMAAAAQMAKSIDDDVMQSISRKINTPGLNLVPPKGLK
jgi:hypothetical protein